MPRSTSEPTISSSGFQALLRLLEARGKRGGRAREIGRLIAESTAEGARSINEQFEAVRVAAERERERTAESLQQTYEQAIGDTNAMFRNSNDRFTEVLQGIRQMAGEMQRELDATRAELRRGILELPQETAESTAQMRRVVVDQIEALHELNRSCPCMAAHRPAEARRPPREEPAMSMAGGGKNQPRPQTRRRPRPAPPPASPAPRRGARNRLHRSGAGQSQRRWLSDSLQRPRAARSLAGLAHRGPRVAAGGSPAPPHHRIVDALSVVCGG